jgi:hypothetical protein
MPRRCSPTKDKEHNMMKVKLVAIFAAMVAVLAVSATSAFAEFSSTKGSSEGKGNSGKVVLEGGGATLECASAEGTGTILNSSGVKATKGPTLALDTEKWNSCKASTSSFKGLEAKVKPCTLDLKQAAGETKAKGAVATECTVETKVLFVTCTIHVAASSENSGLETNTLSNSGSNLLITAADEKITTTTSGSCPGVKGNKENKQKAEIKGEGVNEV